MEKKAFGFLIDCAAAAFLRIGQEMTEVEFRETDVAQDMGAATITVIIGVAGSSERSKGRIMFATDAELAKIMADRINGEPCADTLEFYLCLSEFANIFCGAAVSKFNDAYRGAELRLTPPAVFGGAEMEITTPNVYAMSVRYTSEFGPAMLDVGLEGVR